MEIVSKLNVGQFEFTFQDYLEKSDKNYIKICVISTLKIV